MQVHIQKWCLNLQFVAIVLDSRCNSTLRIWFGNVVRFTQITWLKRGAKEKQLNWIKLKRKMNN